MFKKQKLLLNLIILSFIFTSCGKDTGSFTILSDSTQFEQTLSFTPRKLDVLFVIDNSGSMRTSQENLAQNFSSFINKFIEKDYDFRIAVISTDAFYGDQFVTNGCSLCKKEQTRFFSGANPKVYVIDKSNYDLSDPNEVLKLKETFSKNVLLGTTGSGDERAFSSFKAALNSDLNLGFHRQNNGEDAYLAIVIVSDEEDFSQNNYNMNESYSNTQLHSVASYKTFLDNFTNGLPGEDYSVSTISILDNACKTELLNGNRGAQKIGTRYMQLADLTKGSKNSICESFDSTLDNISTQILVLARPIYTLNKKPIVSTIQVIVDGVVIPESNSNGWSYDSTANTITIYGTEFRPSPGAQIVINFDPDLTQN